MEKKYFFKCYILTNSRFSQTLSPLYFKGPHLGTLSLHLPGTVSFYKTKQTKQKFKAEAETSFIAFAAHTPPSRAFTSGARGSTRPSKRKLQFRNGSPTSWLVHTGESGGIHRTAWNVTNTL